MHYCVSNKIQFNSIFSLPYLLTLSNIPDCCALSDRCVEAPARLCDWLVRFEWAADEPMPVVSRLVQVAYEAHPFAACELVCPCVSHRKSSIQEHDTVSGYS
jgi:hypothetical protein